MKDFLEARCTRKDLAARAFRALLPLISVAETGSYRLRSAEHVDRGAFVAALAASTRCVSDDIRFISVADLPNAPVADWEGDEHYVNHVDMALFFCRGEVAERHGAEVVDVTKMLQGSFMNKTLVAFMAGYGDLEGMMEAQLYDRMLYGIAHVPAYLITYAITGNEEGFRECEALVPLLAQAVPLGESWAELGTWYVLSA